VPKGSGKIVVKNDGKALLLKSRRVKSLVDRKIKPRDVKWTLACRAFLKKGKAMSQKKVSKPKIVKIVRGFPGIPESAIVEKKTGKGQSSTSAKTLSKVRSIAKEKKVYKGDMKKTKF
jgi:large subunit ribosomal protein L24e